MAKNVTRGLGALAALGALGYQLSRGNKRTDGGAPVTDLGTMSSKAEAPEGGMPEGAVMSPAERSGLDISPGEAAAMSGPAIYPNAAAAGPTKTAPVTVRNAQTAAAKPAAAKPTAGSVDAAAMFRASERASRGEPAAGSGVGPGATMMSAAEMARRSVAGGPRGDQSYRRTAGATAADADKGDKVRVAKPAPYVPPPMTAEMRKQAEAQAIQRVYPEEYLAGGPGLKTMHSAAKALANRKPGIAEISQQALPAPTKRLTGPSKGDLTTRDRASRAATREEEMLRENAANYGLNPKAPGYEAASRAMREKLGGSDFTLKKKGGAVKTKKMASGGMTSNFQRADGIASKGKTKCKIY